MARGTALAVLTSGPPLLAARYLPRTEFAPWILGFSILPWLAISQAGLQPGVLALLGEDYGRGGHSSATIGKVAFRTSVLQYGVVCLIAGALFAALSATGLLPSSVRQVLDRRVIAASLLCVGVLQVLVSVGNAFMIGVERSRTVAILTAGGATVFLLATASWVHAADGELSGLSLSILIGIGLMVPVLGSLSHVWRASGAEWDVIAPAAVDFRVQLRRFMLAQAVWVVPGVVITGMDNFLVAEFDPSALRVFSVAIALAGLATAGIGALSSPYISLLASLAKPGSPSGQRGDWERFSRPAKSLSRTAVIGALAISVLGLVPFDRISASLAAEISEAEVALSVLAVAVGIRILTVPLATLVVALRCQSILYPSAIGEAATNAVLSVVLGARYGALGVASGTFAGALIALAGHGYAAFGPLSLMGKDFHRWWAISVAGPAATLSLMVVVKWSV